MKRQMTVILSEHIYNVLKYLSDHHQASKDDLIEEAVREYYSEEIDRGLRVEVAEQTDPSKATYITEDRTQMLDRWQTHNRNTTSAVTPCSNCQEFDCYGCEYKQTEQTEREGER